MKGEPGKKRKRNSRQFRQRRNSLRQQGYNYSSAGWYFITICVSRKSLLRLSRIQGGVVFCTAAGEIVNRIWLQLPRKFPSVDIDSFVVMPDHVHGIVVIRQAAQGSGGRSSEWRGDQKRKMLLPKVVGYFKMNTAKKINQLHNRKGQFWHRGYYDSIIRDEHHLKNVRQYIQNNPANWR